MKGSKLAVDIGVLLTSSLAIGFLIGTIQHYVGFGFWGYGFARDAFMLALFEGGIVGAAVAVPVSLIIYFAILKRRVKKGLAFWIVGGSLIGGCALGIFSVFLTPLLAIAIAYFGQKRVSQGKYATQAVAARDSESTR